MNEYSFFVDYHALRRICNKFVEWWGWILWSIADADRGGFILTSGFGFESAPAGALPSVAKPAGTYDLN
jgi:hypothetical protein